MKSTGDENVKIKARTTTNCIKHKEKES